MMTIPSRVTDLARSISAAGGRLFAVGGWVRDKIAGRDSKDVDLEAHNIRSEDLEAVLLQHGKVDFVGKSFGVYKVTVKGQTLDVSLPRRDSSPTSVQPDPFMGVNEAARRRDITINAIMLDPLTQEIFDPFGGIADLKQGTLREVDQSLFGDDPLRVMRVVRFASIFEFDITDSLATLCRNSDLSGVPIERILTELHRIMLESPNPQAALRVLKSFGQLTTVIPFTAGGSLNDMCDNWLAASELRGGLKSDAQRLVLMWGALVHASSEPPASALGHFKIKRYNKMPLVKPVTELLKALDSTTHDLDTLLRTMAEHCAVSVGIALAVATSSSQTAGMDWEALNTRAKSLNLADGALPTLIDGQTLSDLGVAGGPEMGHWIRAVRQEQLTGRLLTQTEATDWITNQLNHSGD